MRNGGEDIVGALNKLSGMGVTNAAAAAWIRSLDEASLQLPRADLVWSGPDVPGVFARDTRQVYEELLSSAQHSLWVSTYVYFDGPRAFETLARRMDETAGMTVRLLMNIQRPKGDTSTASDIVRRFTERFWTRDWPGASRPMVFYDPRSLDPDRPGGVLHAKAVVADNASVFITSANLTEAAWDRNFELGVLLRDRALAESVASHFQVLVDRELVLPLPEG